MECVVHYTHLSKYSGLRSSTDCKNCCYDEGNCDTRIGNSRIGKDSFTMNSNAKVLAIAKETIDKDRLKVHPKCCNKLILINRNKKYLDTTSKTPIGDSKLSSAPLPQEFCQTGSSILRQPSVLCK